MKDLEGTTKEQHDPDTRRLTKETDTPSLTRINGAKGGGLYKMTDEEFNARIRESVDHPAHYGGANNPYEHVKVMEAILQYSPMNGFVGGLIYNCTKYLWRLGQKSEGEGVDGINKATLQDAKKAQWYLNRLVSYLEKEHGTH